MLLLNMAEIEKVKVEFPACHLVTGEFSIRWQHLVFILISLHTLFSCAKRNVTDMLCCRVFALPSTKKITADTS